MADVASRGPETPGAVSDSIRSVRSCIDQAATVGKQRNHVVRINTTSSNTHLPASIASRQSGPPTRRRRRRRGIIMREKTLEMVRTISGAAARVCWTSRSSVDTQRWTDVAAGDYVSIQTTTSGSRPSRTVLRSRSTFSVRSRCCRVEALQERKPKKTNFN